MKAIVIGSGGREHAIAWALASSPDVSEVVCVPGNGGTATEHKCRNIAVSIAETAEVVRTCSKELEGRADGSFVVVGPEDPLAAGLADRLSLAGIPVVGPHSRGAQLEASKDVAKRFMDKYGVACAKSATFTEHADAIAEIGRRAGPIVVKADGLAAGKGVVVAPDGDTAIQAVRDFMVDSTLGAAGRKVVIEEYLEGEEISILAAVSVTPELAAAGKASIVPFVPARDHKRRYEGAQGPNTGGMGAIAPVDGVSEETLARFNAEILEPTLRGLIAEKFDYRGFIFFGVMLTKEGPKLLEYNVRLGDPETQAVLPLMNFDFAAMCRSIIDGTVAGFPFAWKRGTCCAPVAVSRGYPGPYEKGHAIAFDHKKIDASGAKVFIAGATVDQRHASRGIGEPQWPEGTLITTGGRVLAASAIGSGLDEARERAYRGLEAVSFDGMSFRRDIGLPGAAVSKGF